MNRRLDVLAEQLGPPSRCVPPGIVRELTTRSVERDERQIPERALTRALTHWHVAFGIVVTASTELWKPGRKHGGACLLYTRDRAVLYDPDLLVQALETVGHWRLDVMVPGRLESPWESQLRGRAAMSDSVGLTQVRIPSHLTAGVVTYAATVPIYRQQIAPTGLVKHPYACLVPENTGPDDWPVLLPWQWVQKGLPKALRTASTQADDPEPLATDP